MARADAGLPVLFTGEMIFPWMFDEVRRRIPDRLEP